MTASSSAASLGGDDKTVIAQLEQSVGELNEVIGLHRYAEQELTKKLRHFESTRSKGDINYEYVKNIFLKYVAFSRNGAKEEVKRLESLMLDLLHVNREEKDSLAKATEGSKTSSYLWGLFSAPHEPTLANLNASYVAMPPKFQRSQTETLFDAKRRESDAEVSMELDRVAGLRLETLPVPPALGKKK